ncbi:hypothetical protein Tco_1103094 [Tanacetum coccineum]
MAGLKFADTYNLVAFLSELAESEGYEQIVDFLNANPIRYALTINPTIYISCIEQFWFTVKAKTVNGEVQLHDLVDEKKIIITESTMRRDLQLEDAESVDCLSNSTIFEQLTLMGLVRAATTASSLEVEQDNSNIAKTQSKATPNESNSLRTTSGGGPRHQETMGDTISQTRFENVSKHSNDLLLARVLDLEKTKSTQAEEIVSLKRRVKKLEQKNTRMRINAYMDADEALPWLMIKDDRLICMTVNTLLVKAIVGRRAQIYQGEDLRREKDEPNFSPLTEEWDDIDYQLAQRLQAKEQEKFTTEQKATLFKELLEQRRKHFAAKRAEEKRNKPPTKTQHKKTMITYL